jgi:hypothetical protein
MGMGFECYDASGRLMFSASDRLGRVLGVINLVAGNASGSLTDSNLLSGDPYAVFFRDGSGSRFVPCAVTVSGQTVSWTYEGPYANQSTNNPGGFIVYGVR